MAINIKFDSAGNPEPSTIILAKRNGQKLGQLYVDEKSIELVDKFNDASEISFTLNKYVDGELTNLWDKVIDFKLIYCKEWDMWFEIKVELDEATETVKTVFGTQLGQAELSQIMLYNIEINTEEDIERDDYKISILYDENNPKSSILNRLLDKAPHYTVTHVDSTIAKIQRSFSFDSTSILDAFQEIADEIGCLFVFPSNSGEDGKINRAIEVYDLEQNCNDCGHRGEFTDVCPKCGSTDIEYGHGDDTLIFVTADELASDGINFTTDTDSVKNCFKLEAGDDLMTATIRNCNPNGTDYIWRFSDIVKDDMSNELVEKIESYNKIYEHCYKDNIELNFKYFKDDMSEYFECRLFDVPENLCYRFTTSLYRFDILTKDERNHYFAKDVAEIKGGGNILIMIFCPYEKFSHDIYSCYIDYDISTDSYNELVDKYSVYNEDLQKIIEPVKGYPALMNAYYNTVDFELYLKSSLMPSIEMSETNANEQANLLTASSMSPVAVANIKALSLSTANSAVLSMAKTIVKPTYKVEINTSEITNNGDGDETWTGNFVITNYSDEEDTVVSNTISITVNGDEESFIKQKIEKALNKGNTDDYSVSALFEKEYDDFCAELKKYALNPLISFRDACQACIDILIEQGVTEDGSKSGSDDNLYEKLYLPYYDKLVAIEAETKIREDEINIITGIYDSNGELLVDGMQTNIEKCRNQIQDLLNFEEYLGKDLWTEFCSYRREDTYSNENYISDGLNNAEIFENALEFIEVAENEIYKSSELQCSISTSLNNLLAIPKFKHLIDYFKNGNWIRVRVDDQIYKLRMIEYSINFGDFNTIPVEFSNITKVKNGITDVESILSQASSMATSYDSIKRQSKQGNKAQDTIDQWIDYGLNSAIVQIQSNDNEDIILTKNGLLCRSYDDIAETHSPEQFKLTHNIMAYTTDNWKTVSAALGKHEYNYFDSDKILNKAVDYGLSAKFVTAGYISGSQIIGGEIFSFNYSEANKTGSYINLTDGAFDFAGGKLKYNNNKLTVEGEINATSGTIGGCEISNGVLKIGNTNIGEKLTSDSIDANSLKVKAANIEGQLTASQINTTGLIAENISGDTISGKTISGGSIDIGDGNFTVTSAGKMTTKSGEIAGNLSISGSLTNTKGNYTVTLRGVQSTVSNGVFYITDKSSGSNVYPFIVGGDGSFTATKAKITGNSTFGGKLDAVSGTFTKLTAGKSSFATNQVIIDASYTDSNGDEVSKGSIYIGRSGVDGWEDITIRPSSDNLGNIGTAGKSWDIAYIGKGVVQTSDRNYKKDIFEMGENQERLFDLLTPVTYKFINNTNDRIHYGFISQDVEDAIIKSGLTTREFSGFIKNIIKDDNGNFILDKDGNCTYSYALKYDEFIALNTYMIKKLKSENHKLEERISYLENKLG